MNSKDILIEITSEGSCLSIWSDENPLAMLGDVEVTRLSDVEFNSYLQGWEVTFRNGTKLPGLYKQRIEALSAEISWVEDHLSEMGEWVKEHFPERVPRPSLYCDPSIS